MRIRPLRKDLVEYLSAHNLRDRWRKACSFFETNIRHPSLETELLEPHWHGIHSFRIDRKYRALFIIEGGEAEIFKITNHYKK